MTDRYEKEIDNRLQTSASFQTHLANVISGMNHEVAPWLGGAINSINRLEKLINSLDKNNVDSVKKKCLQKIEKITHSIEQSSNILSMLSSNVKKLQSYSLSNSKLSDTINSWVRLVLMDRLIKNLISESNIVIDSESLNFCVTHSPMLLSQIILNLAKNSLEHNPDFLQELKIKIYGYEDKKTLVFEDNGCGIPKDILCRVFSPNTTSKKDETHQHGLGLSICMDYCIAMNATIWVKSIENEYTRFIIKFENTYESNRYEPQVSGEIDVDQMLEIYESKRIMNKRQEEENW